MWDALRCLCFLLDHDFMLANIRAFLKPSKLANNNNNNKSHTHKYNIIGPLTTTKLLL